MKQIIKSEVARLMGISVEEIHDNYQLNILENMDSMSILSFIVFMDENYGVLLKWEQMQHIRTFSDILKLVN